MIPVTVSIQNDSGLPQKCRTQACTSTCAVKGSHRSALATKGFFGECEARPPATLPKLPENQIIADDEAEQIRKLEAAGMQVTRPDLAPFRAKMEPAYACIATYAREANVKKFRELVEQGRNARP